MGSDETTCRIRTTALYRAGLAFAAAALLVLLPGWVQSAETDWVVSHISLGIRNFDETVALYESAGVGVHTPIQVPKGPRPPDTHSHINVRYGEVQKRAVAVKPEEAARMMTFVQVGDLQYETGWGHPGMAVERVDHICFNVPDLHAVSAPLIEKGLKVPFLYIRDHLIEENHLEPALGKLKLSFRPDPHGRRGGWEKTSRERLPINSWKFRGLGILVGDLDKVVTYYQSLKIGTFRPEAEFDTGAIADTKLYGKAPYSPIKARTRKLLLGPVVFEFIQPLEGAAVFKESFDSRGDGVGILAFTVDDLDKETAKLTENDVSPLLSGNPRNGGAFAYFDIHRDRKPGDILIKLIQGE